MEEFVFAPEAVAATRDPLVKVLLGPDGRPAGAVASARIDAPSERVWIILRDLEAYPARIPMVQQIRLEGDRLTMRLAFRIALFTARFGYTAVVRREEGRWLDIQYLSGEPRDLRLRFDLVPAAPAACLLYVAIRFDIKSVGWLVKFFLKHHPEIQNGVFPGSALTLLDSIRRAAEPRA